MASDAAPSRLAIALLAPPRTRCTSCGEARAVHGYGSHRWCNDCARDHLDAKRAHLFCSARDCTEHALSKVCDTCGGTAYRGGEICGDCVEEGRAPLDRHEEPYCAAHQEQCCFCGGSGEYEHQDGSYTDCESCERTGRTAS